MLVILSIFTVLSFTHHADGIIICSGHISGLPGYVVVAPGESINITVNYEFGIEQCEKATLYPSFSVDMPSINAGMTGLDEKGKFVISFTGPKDAREGIYKAELKIDEGMTGTTARQIMYVRVTDAPNNRYNLTVGDNAFEMVIPNHLEQFLQAI